MKKEANIDNIYSQYERNKKNRKKEINRYNRKIWFLIITSSLGLQVISGFIINLCINILAHNKLGTRNIFLQDYTIYIYLFIPSIIIVFFILKSVKIELKQEWL